MDNNEELCKELESLQINIVSLSENERTYLGEIRAAFVRFSEKVKGLIRDLETTKFNYTTVTNEVSCTRQTIYTNPVLKAYTDYCIKKADRLKNNNTANTVSKEKYDSLKEEYNRLLVNIIDNENRNLEFERLQNKLQDTQSKLIASRDRGDRLVMALRSAHIAIPNGLEFDNADTDDNTGSNTRN